MKKYEVISNDSYELFKKEINDCVVKTGLNEIKNINLNSFEDFNETFKVQLLFSNVFLMFKNLDVENLKDDSSSKVKVIYNKDLNIKKFNIIIPAVCQYKIEFTSNEDQECLELYLFETKNMSLDSNVKDFMFMNMRLVNEKIANELSSLYERLFSEEV